MLVVTVLLVFYIYIKGVTMIVVCHSNIVFFIFLLTPEIIQDNPRITSANK